MNCNKRYFKDIFLFGEKIYNNIKYSPNKSPNKINKKISDLGLAILSLISNNPGIKVPEIFEIISRTDSNINIDKIRYSIKAELKEMIELKGSKEIGGYYIK